NTRGEFGTLILIEINFNSNWETANNLGWVSLTGLKLKHKTNISLIRSHTGRRPY
ncbi:hypothetical protein GIB67_018527, partial [Kingdonia uniflora]